MEPIYIPQLTQAPQQTVVVQTQEFLPGLETLTPVRGQIRVQHCGNYLEVSAQTETIITLTCHRCLKQYNHRLTLDTTEVIWLDPTADKPENLPLEQELAIEDLVETLPPQGYFYPDKWLYEQLCLEIPPRQLCDAACAGIETTHQAEDTSVDRRWSSLEVLKKQLPS